MRACVHARPFTRALDTPVAEAAHDEHLITHRGKRLQDRCQLEVGAPTTLRVEVREKHPVRDREEGHARHRRRGRLSGRRQRGHHRVEKRQRDGGTEATENGSPRDRFLGDEHIVNSSQ